ncbi:MAG: hypothetical protein AB7P40_15805 [Chloroflexota bacterium]
MVNEIEGPVAERDALPASPPQVALLYGRVMGGDAGLAQVWFRQEVLDRYRSQAGFRVIRTNSAGRVQVRGGWMLDFGISSDDQLIHASAKDLAERLPAAERRHWTSFLYAPPVSGTFLTMRLGAGHCLDDGDVRSWSS